jgi:cobalt/nickel transport system permease protein
MNRIEDRFFDVGYMDTLAAGKSSLHGLDPRVKLIATLAFIVTVVSFDKYALSALIPFILYPIVLISVGGLPVRYLLKKVLLVLPVALVIGIFNPLIDREAYFYLGSLGVSGGWVSFLSILLRFVLTVSAALILLALTGFNAVCMALAKFGVPRPFVVQLLFFYRYLFVLTDEAERLVRARSLRSFNSRAMGFGTFVPLSGHLLLRTLDRAQRIYLAMCCRGFDGHIRIVRAMKIGFKEVVFLSGWILLFVVFRLFNIPEKLGMLVTEVFL